MDRNTGFAQYGLRNAGQLVRIGPSLGMAEFISNSAILTTIRASAVLAAAPNSGPGRPKMADFEWKSAIAQLSALVALMTRSADPATWADGSQSILQGRDSA